MNTNTGLLDLPGLPFVDAVITNLDVYDRYELVVENCRFCGRRHVHGGGRTFFEALSCDGASRESPCGRQYRLRLLQPAPVGEMT